MPSSGLESEMRVVRGSKVHQLAVVTAMLAVAMLVAVVPARAAGAVAVPVLDPNRLIGAYYTVERFPVRKQKACLGNESVLYALGDKKNTLQIVTACECKLNNFNSWNKTGKFSEAGDGKIRTPWFWPFKSNYWVLGLAPDYSWALVGTPNHKSLWVLSRVAAMDAGTLATVTQMATAQGFDVGKLKLIPQPGAKSDSPIVAKK
jgi:apolipoprotein D and lipocalin family protein